MAIGNLTSSVLYGIFHIGPLVHFDPLSFWIGWFLESGMLAIILAVVGVYLIKYGYEVIKESKKDLT